MGQSHIESVVKATTLEEAWKARCASGDAARFLGGGIDLAIFTPPSVTTLIDLAGLELSYVRRSADCISIGATTTMTDVSESELIRGHVRGILAEVLRKVASPLQRNLATFGGTIAGAHPWSDVVPVLLVLDAELVVYDGAERTVPLPRFYAGRGEGISPLIVEIRLPDRPAAGRAAFEEFALTRFDVAMLNCACYGRVEDDRWTEARVAIGGSPALARRLETVEEMLCGGLANSSVIEEAAAKAGEVIEVRDDRRASAAYRRTLARVGVKRCLERIVGKAEESQR